MANEDTLLLMMFSWASKRGNICRGPKMFLKEIRNIFCVSDTNFASATNVARAGKQGNICVRHNVSATLCPRLPPPLELSDGLQKSSKYCRDTKYKTTPSVEGFLFIIGRAKTKY